MLALHLSGGKIQGVSAQGLIDQLLVSGGLQHPAWLMADPLLCKPGVRVLGNGSCGMRVVTDPKEQKAGSPRPHVCTTLAVSPSLRFMHIQRLRPPPG